MPSDKNAAEAIVQHLIDAGIKHVFGITGDTVLPILDAMYDRGDEIRVEAGEEGGRFLLVSGEPLREPVAWRGPIVMNTEEELKQAWRELRDGTFIKD